jgi:hypothetical protein
VTRSRCLTPRVDGLRSRTSGFSLVATCLLTICIALAFTGHEPARAGVQRPALSLISQSSYVSGAEGSFFQISLRVSNAIIDAVNEDSELVITSHRPITSREEMRSALDDDMPQIIDAVRYPVRDLLAASTTPSEPGRVDLFVRTEIGTRSAEALQMSATGVYPLTVDIELSGERIVRLVSFIERLEPTAFAPSSTASLDLSLVGRISAPVSLGTDATTTVSSTSRQLISDWISLLERRSNIALTVAVQPELVEAFSRSTPEDQELLIRLQRVVPFDVMSTTYVNMDPTDADRHGLSNIFTRQLRLGETTLASLFPARIAPRHSWLQSQPLSSGGARVLADLGFRTVVVPPDARSTMIEENAGDEGVDIFQDVDTTRLVEMAFSDEGSIMGAIGDVDLAASLERGSNRPPGGEHLIAHQILADLKMWRLEMERNDIDPGQRALVLSTPSGDMPTALMTDALFDVVGRDPRFAFSPFDTALTKMINIEETEQIQLLDLLDRPATKPANATLASVVQGLDSTIDAFASVLPREDERVRSWRDILDVIPDAGLDTTERSAYAETVRSGTRDVTSSIVPPASTTFTLGGRDSPIRFSIRNDGPTDLDVLVRLRSSKLRLPEGDKLVTLAAQTSTAVEFAVSARSNGRFPVTLQVLTPSGEEALVTPATLTARVNALAGLGQLVTGIALLFLISWWANHFRREYLKRQSESDLGVSRHPSGDRTSGDQTRG